MRTFSHASERDTPTFRMPLGTPLDVLIRAEYPILLAAAAALSAAGAGMSMAGNAKANSEMDAKRNAELLRQRGYQAEADAQFATSLDKSDVETADQQIDTGAAQREAAYANLRNATSGLTTTPARNQPVGEQASGAAARTTSSVQATNNAWTNLQGAARARLGGYQDWGLQSNIKDRRASQDLGITATKARQSANVLPLEMQDAAHAGDGLKAWGQLVGALGAVAGMGAAVGAGSAAAGSGNAALGAGSGTGAEFSNAWASALGYVP